MVGWRHRLARFPFRQRWLAQTIFHLKFDKIEKDDYYFDLITWPLINTVRKLLPNSAKVIDLGAGAHGIVGLALWHCCDADIISVELNPQLAINSLRTIKQNASPNKIFCGRSFKALKPCGFDAIVFNPPYVSENVALNLNLPISRQSQWDGGIDGTKSIREFFAEYSSFNIAEYAILGLNRCFVDKNAVAEAKKPYKKLILHKVDSYWPIPADIYIFKHINGHTKHATY